MSIPYSNISICPKCLCYFLQSKIYKVYVLRLMCVYYFQQSLLFPTPRHTYETSLLARLCYTLVYVKVPYNLDLTDGFPFNYWSIKVHAFRECHLPSLFVVRFLIKWSLSLSSSSSPLQIHHSDSSVYKACPEFYFTMNGFLIYLLNVFEMVPCPSICTAAI